MADLRAFRQAVRDARRFVGRTQAQLARAVGMHPNVLSHKLNGHAGFLLAVPDVTAIVTTLAGWGAISSRAEAEALMAVMSLPPRVIADQPWNSGPLSTLTTDDRGPAPYEGNVGAPLTAPWWRYPGPSGALRPVPPPEPPTPLVGRAAEVQTAAAAMEMSRLVTLTGPGGTGKTRVALAVAKAAAPRFADGVAFADLAPVLDPGSIADMLIRAIGVVLRPDVDLEAQLTEALRPADLLLVVDNLEHLLAGADVLGRLLAAAPRVHLLVTSRVPLQLYGEHLVKIPGLNVPSSVELFRQRARAVRQGFAPSGPELKVVAAICSALDGMPLAIELAAARAGTTPLLELFERLGQRLSFLRQGPRNVHRRHQSLQATLEWSESLLSAGQRQVLAQLGVFTGDFDARAAAAVLGSDEPGARDRLDELVERSLLDVSPGPGADAGPVRFRMLESVHQFALVRLEESGRLDRLRRVHLRYFRDLVHGAQVRDLDRLETELANIKAALVHARATAQVDAGCRADGLQLAADMIVLWHRRSSVQEGRDQLRALLDADADASAGPEAGSVAPEIRTHALLRAAALSCLSCDVDEAATLADAGLQLATELGDVDQMIYARSQLGEIGLVGGNLVAAAGHFTAMLQLARQAGHALTEAMALNALGLTAFKQGDHGAAGELFRRSLTLFEALDDLDHAAAVMDSIGNLEQDRGRVPAAASWWAKALRANVDVGNTRDIAYNLEGCACVAAARGCPADALRYASAARQLRDTGGWLLPPAEQDLLDRRVGPTAMTLTEDERERALAAGRTQNLDIVIADALAQLDAAATAAA